MQLKGKELNREEVFYVLFSVWFLSKRMGVVLIVARGRPHSLALSNSSVWEGEVQNREEGEMAWNSTEEGDLPFCTSSLLSDVSDFPFKLPCVWLRNKAGIFDEIKSYRDFFSMQLIIILKIDCVLNTQPNPSPPSHWSFSDGEILTEFISWYLPSNKPHQDLGDQRKVRRTKVLHRYESGITQGSHHFGKIYKKKRRGFSLNLGPLP